MRLGNGQKRAPGVQKDRSLAFGENIAVGAGKLLKLSKKSILPKQSSSTTAVRGRRSAGSSPVLKKDWGRTRGGGGSTRGSARRKPVFVVVKAADLAKNQPQANNQPQAS